MQLTKFATTRLAVMAFGAIFSSAFISSAVFAQQPPQPPATQPSAPVVAPSQSSPQPAVTTPPPATTAQPPAAPPPAVTTQPAPAATPPAAPGTDATLPPVEVIQKKPEPKPEPPPRTVRKAPTKPVQKAAAPAAPTPAPQQPTAPPQQQPASAPLSTPELRAEGEVVRVAPIGGSEVPVGKVPGATTTVSAATIAKAASNEPQDILQKEVPGIIIGDVAGNDLRTQVEYRGFDAGGVNGFPQGLAIYQNGVRINEVFGDTVNWDLIPKNAISDMTVLSGNPIFGLNAIGGAISIVMKDGFTYRGAEVDVMGGSFGRRQIAAQAGGSSGPIGAFFAGELIEEDGWRQFSPAEVKRAYFDIGAKGSRVEVHANLTIADSSAGVVTASPVELLAAGRDLVYTNPQVTGLKLVMPSFNASIKMTDTLTLSGVAYYRNFKSRVLDGNVYESDDDDDDDDDAAPQGVLDRIHTDAESYGFTLQAVEKARLFGHKNQFVLGTSYDKGKVGYTTTSELGTIEDNFVVVGSGIILDDDDFAPRNVAVNTRNFGLYFLDTLDLTDRLTLTFGGRYNLAKVDLEDLTGDFPDITSKHTFQRFNPTVGATYEMVPGITLYGGYSEANRAPTPAELACANPDNPCPIESFLTDDPPLSQVVSKTFELGLRGKMKSADDRQRLDWGIGLFRTTNYDDILFVSSSTTGRGYFFNAGETLRQGLEASLKYKYGPLTTYASYSYVRATYETANEFSSPAHPLAEACVGLAEDACIQVQPGDRIPGIPAHRFKTGFDYWVTPRWRVGADLIAATGQYYFGDNANLLDKLAGYTRVDISTSFDVTEHIQIYAFAKNIFDAKYGLFGTLFDAEEAPVVGPHNIEFENNRSIVPAAPVAVYGGVKVKF